MQTKVKEPTEDDKKLLAIQKQKSVLTQETRPVVGLNKILKQPTDHSTNFDEFQQKESRKSTTQGGARKKLSTVSANRSIKRAKTNDLGSRKSVSRSKGRISNGMVCIDGPVMSASRSRSFGRSNTSGSPNVHRVMDFLTHPRVKIDEKTKVHINGSEVLTQNGITGKINTVGYGFGTGRHLADRKLDLYKEIATQAEPMPEIVRIVPGTRILPSEPIEVPESPEKPGFQPTYRAKSPVQPKPIRMDAETQHFVPDHMSAGCDPILKSVKSQMISAHVTQNEVCLSARTLTVMPEKESMGCSARPLSEASCREQGDQITEGRFEPQMIDTAIGTGTDLLDNYLYKPKIDSSMMTSPIIFGEKKPQMVSAQ